MCTEWIEWKHKISENSIKTKRMSQFCLPLWWNSCVYDLLNFWTKAIKPSEKETIAFRINIHHSICHQICAEWLRLNWNEYSGRMRMTWDYFSELNIYETNKLRRTKIRKLRIFWQLCVLMDNYEWEQWMREKEKWKVWCGCVGCVQFFPHPFFITYLAPSNVCL